MVRLCWWNFKRAAFKLVVCILKKCDIIDRDGTVPATVTGMHIWKSIDTRDNDLVRLTM